MRITKSQYRDVHQLARITSDNNGDFWLMPDERALLERIVAAPWIYVESFTTYSDEGEPLPPTDRDTEVVSMARLVLKFAA